MLSEQQSEAFQGSSWYSGMGQDDFPVHKALICYSGAFSRDICSFDRNVIHEINIVEFF